MGLHGPKIRVNTQNSTWVPTAYWPRAPTGSLGKKRTWRQCTWCRTGSEAWHSTHIMIGITITLYVYRREAWFHSPDTMRCSFLGNGLGDRAVILVIFKPVCLQECRALRSLTHFTSFSSLSACAVAWSSTRLYVAEYTDCGGRVVLLALDDAVAS